MKSVIIFSVMALMLFASISQTSFATEIQEEPGPPQIPEPEPEPDPIRKSDPEPVPDPFPGETESEKIQRLTAENNNLKQQITNLQGEISTLKSDKLQLQAQISELNASIESLKEITMEQIRVIMDLANKLKDVLFEKIFSPTINL